jgi:hypothetical protein
MAKYKHENIIIDLTTAGKSKLYIDDKLVFVGDGYKAITMMVRNCADPTPVENKFNAQLSTRQPSKFKDAK